MASRMLEVLMINLKEKINKSNLFIIQKNLLHKKLKVLLKALILLKIS